VENDPELTESVSAKPSNGERRQLSILFTDIVGSTQHAARLDPEEWKDVVAGAHRRVSESVLRFGGTVAQLLGDGVLVYFGTPIAHEDDAIRAVHSALEIQRSMRSYREELGNLVDDFQLRIGIHCGRVVIAEFGDGAHREHLAVGSPVIVADRLQEAADPGGVLVSDAIASLVKGHFELRRVGPLRLKNVESPVLAFHVIRAKRLPQTLRGLPGMKTPLVGRDDALEKLHTALSALQQSHGQVTVVMGEAGIGKTRLVDEARTRVMADPGVDGTSPRLRWLEGRAISYGEGLPFWAISRLLLSDLGLLDGESPVRISVALKRRIRSLLGDLPPSVTPYLLHLMGAPLEADWAESLQQLDGEARKFQTTSALTIYLEKVAEKTPTVLLLEDAHWLDPSSLGVIENLLPLTDRVPLMVLMLMRVDRNHGSWRLRTIMERDYPQRWSEIHLRGLSHEESVRLAASLLETRVVDKGEHQTLLGRAGGNPFYLEELVRDLIERRPAETRAEVAGSRQGNMEEAIPATLQGLLSGRIDRLSEADRRTLQLASVIGQTFLLRILEAVSDGNGSRLEPSLASLLRAEFLREKSCLPEREYAFQHSLIQEAAYHSMLIEKRKAVHKKVGEALETLFPDRREEFLGLLAHHFEHADDKDKAVAYLLDAGDRARLGDELPEAVEYYNRALQFLTEPQSRERAAKTWLKLALVHQAAFDFQAAHAANEQAFALAEQDHSPISNKAHEEEAIPVHRPEVVFHFPLWNLPQTLDPAKTKMLHEGNIVVQIFAGLADLDADTNVVPHVARSWEVLDDGLRYVFHLRDDVFWSDGRKVTADDFEWAWKRNLAPETGGFMARLLDPVVGARSYRLGEISDPSSVGAHAIDERTFEVVLEAPTAQFLYTAALPITFPLPEWQVKRAGEAWWHPESIVSNGPFLLESLDQDRLRLVRNRRYFGEFRGNLDRVDLFRLSNEAEGEAVYRQGRADMAYITDWPGFPEQVRHQEGLAHRDHSTSVLILHSTRAPLDNVMVREALVRALDREALQAGAGLSATRVAHGGVVPPGMAGHSPELSPPFNPEAARRLLGTAGYPGGMGLRNLRIPKVERYPNSLVYEELARQWRTNLGIDIQWEDAPGWFADSRVMDHCDVWWVGVICDLPDPSNLLRKSDIYFGLRQGGWEDPRFEEYVARAASCSIPSERMALLRQADRLLVAEENLVIPTSYGAWGFYLVKPWVKNLRLNATRRMALRNVVIEDRPD
jgi:ABC-type oligopeptide transport system substrate-binding subunit/class 3 adenylate cyclase